MKISKAIEILNDHVAWCDPKQEVDTLDALKLGIMALKKHQDRNTLTYHGMLLLLPGETNED